MVFFILFFILSLHTKELCICPNSDDTNTDNNKVMTIKNQRPIIITNSPIQVRRGHSFTLDASKSYDPDQHPFPYLTYYWKQFEAPNTSRYFNLTENDMTKPRVHIKKENYKRSTGQFTFIIYVSDGQGLSWDFVNVTIL